VAGAPRPREVHPEAGGGVVSLQWDRVYRRAKLRMTSGVVTDLEGNFTLQCASQRALRLLWRLTKSRTLRGFIAPEVAS
jgi:hypothetical protein